MDTFFSLLKKGLVATVFLIFGFVATYVPQPYNQVEEAHAGGLAGGATEVTQIANNVQLAAVNVATTASAGFDAITSWATNSVWIKEYVLDGIGWALAKALVQRMVASLIDWINSGFQGRPQFLQDLKGFLLETADQVIGEYLSELGGPFSFICSPFQLDVQVSVALEYDRARSRGGDGQPAPTCTLSGMIGNVQDFLQGTFAGGGAGGWQDWIEITSQPRVHTPYGAGLSARADARARIINAQGEEVTLLDFGDGFLSGEICDIVHGSGSPREECFITKPGKVIEEALSFNLDSGRQSLITADEINEIIAALLGQLANQVMQGAAGLLGLSGGTGYTYSGYGTSFTDSLASSTTTGVDLAAAGTLISDALTTQQDIRNLAVTYTTGGAPNLVACANDTTQSAARQTACQNALVDANTIIQVTTGASGGSTAPAGAGNTGMTATAAIAPTPTSVIGQLQTINTAYAAATAAGDTDAQLNLVNQFSALTLYTTQDVTTRTTNWDNALR